MTDALGLLNNAILLGLCFSGLALSLVFSLRFLNFPDLTIEGSFPLGAAAGSAALVASGSLPLAFLAAIASGLLAGSCTAFLHVFLRVGKLLSGILMLSALYSICLRVLGGSNISLLRTESWFSKLEALDRNLGGGAGVSADLAKITFLACLMGSLILAAHAFFTSRSGIAIRSIGDNERVLVNLGRDPRPYKFLALALGNAAAALSGLLVAMNQGFADVSMGQGGLVLGLAALILGEQTAARIVGPRRLVLALLLAALVGSVLYQVALLFALRAGIAPSDLKLFTALIVLAAMVAARGGSAFYAERTF